VTDKDNPERKWLQRVREKLPAETFGHIQPFVLKKVVLRKNPPKVFILTMLTM
jgi:hypothetical protein